MNSFTCYNKKKGIHKDYRGSLQYIHFCVPATPLTTENRKVKTKQLKCSHLKGSATTGLSIFPPTITKNQTYYNT